jgi:TrkA domain protein
MADITEVQLPGVGTRYDFSCLGGTQVGVIVRHSGRRELVVYDDKDPDAVAAAVELSADESRTLADLLGGSSITEQLAATVKQVEGLAIDWLPVPRDFATCSIGQTELRTRTGVSIIALVRGDEPVPAPGPDAEIRAGDVVVVTGTVEGIRRAEDLLSS